MDKSTLKRRILVAGLRDWQKCGASAGATDKESIISLSVSFAGEMHRPQEELGNFARSHNDTLRNIGGAKNRRPGMALMSLEQPYAVLV